jgi:CheY-like chemotaxis protein
VQRNVENNQGAYCEYELILMDCNMPIMDGYESTNQIRKFLKTKKLKQPIISAITGHTEQSYATKAINFGLNQIISKPASPNTIKKLLEKFNFKKLK